MKINIKVVPNSRKNQIIGWIGNRLKVKICKPPKEGQANKELIDFLSKEWELPKHCISLVQGFRNRDKTIEVLSDKIIQLPPKPQRLI